MLLDGQVSATLPSPIYMSRMAQVCLLFRYSLHPDLLTHLLLLLLLCCHHVDHQNHGGGGVKMGFQAIDSGPVMSLATPVTTHSTLPISNELTVKPFQRVNIPIRSPVELTYRALNHRLCPACLKHHPQGACELKAAGVEHCGLCGLAHFGRGRQCPHIKSETQVREMLKALKNSPEKKELVDAAIKYLRGVKGALVQSKRRARERLALQAGQPLQPPILPGGQPPRPTLPWATNGSGMMPVSRDLHNHAIPGSVQGLGQGQRGAVAQQQYTQQLQPQVLDDQYVESALKGYLGNLAPH